MDELQQFTVNSVGLAQSALAPFKAGCALKQDVERLEVTCLWFARAEGELAAHAARARDRMAVMQATLCRSAISGPSAQPFLEFERDAQAAIDKIEDLLRDFSGLKRALDVCLTSVRPKQVSR